jgi:hypothetical protein
MPGSGGIGALSRITRRSSDLGFREEEFRVEGMV